MDIVFGKKWFETHQSKLLWLLNTPIIKYWFRWVMRIKENGVINKITPNSYSFNGRYINDKEIEITTDFRNHNKYSKRLYYSFKLFWYLIHFWDFTTQIQPQLNMGFDTLTQYPGSTGAGNPVDGKIFRGGVNEAFSTIRAGAGTGTDTTNARVGIFADTTSEQYTQLERYLACFDTSSITDGATISSAVFSIYGFIKNEGLTGQSIGIVSSNPASTSSLSSSDYSTLGTTRFASDVALATINTAGYEDFSLNATGIATISDTGITKLGVKISCDIDNSAPTWVSGANARWNFYQASRAGTSEDPKLVVTYSIVIPDTGFFNIL